MDVAVPLSHCLCSYLKWQSQPETLFSYVKTGALLKTFTFFLLAKKKLVGCIMQKTRETQRFLPTSPKHPKMQDSSLQRSCALLLLQVSPGPFRWACSHFQEVLGSGSLGMASGKGTDGPNGYFSATGAPGTCLVPAAQGPHLCRSCRPFWVSGGMQGGMGYASLPSITSFFGRVLGHSLGRRLPRKPTTLEPSLISVS